MVVCGDGSVDLSRRGGAEHPCPRKFLPTPLHPRLAQGQSLEEGGREGYCVTGFIFGGYVHMNSGWKVISGG